MVQVGDVVATWEEVPEGALFQDLEGDLAIKRAGRGLWVRCDGQAFNCWVFDCPLATPLRIVALGVPVDAVVEQLCRLAPS